MLSTIRAAARKEGRVCVCVCEKCAVREMRSGSWENRATERLECILSKESDDVFQRNVIPQQLKGQFRSMLFTLDPLKKSEKLKVNFFFLCPAKLVT